MEHMEHEDWDQTRRNYLAAADAEAAAEAAEEAAEEAAWLTVEPDAEADKDAQRVFEAEAEAEAAAEEARIAAMMAAEAAAEEVKDCFKNRFLPVLRAVYVACATAEAVYVACATAEEGHMSLLYDARATAQRAASKAEFYAELLDIDTADLTDAEAAADAEKARIAALMAGYER